MPKLYIFTCGSLKLFGSVCLFEHCHSKSFCRGPVDRGFQTGGFPDLDLSFLFCLFWDFPDFLGFSPFVWDCPGIFPICPSRLSRPSNSTYEEQSRKGPRHNPDLSRKKVGNPLVWNPAYLLSLLAWQNPELPGIFWHFLISYFLRELGSCILAICSARAPTIKNRCN